MMNSPLAQRRAGIPLHVTSLPGPGACGSLGSDAYRFVDFLAAAGQSVWQTLPVGLFLVVGLLFLSLSLHVGVLVFFCFVFLFVTGWLTGDEAASLSLLEERLQCAWQGFQQRACVDVL